MSTREHPRAIASGAVISHPAETFQAIHGLGGFKVIALGYRVGLQNEETRRAHHFSNNLSRLLSVPAEKFDELDCPEHAEPIVSGAVSHTADCMYMTISYNKSPQSLELG